MNKQTPLYRICYVLPLLGAAMLGAPAPVFAETAATHETAAPGAVSFQYNFSSALQSKGDTQRVTFSEPMVKEDQVGHEVPLADYFELDGKAVLTAKWVAVGCLELTLAEDFDKYGDIATVRVKPGLRSVHGREMGSAAYTFGCMSGVNVEVSYWSFDNNCKYVLIAPNADKEAELQAFEEAVRNACFRVHVDGTQQSEDTTMPAKVRPATVADVLGDWGGFSRLCGGETTDDDRHLFEAKNPEELVPHIWRMEIPGVPSADDTVTLVLPKLGWYDVNTGGYNDLRLCSFHLGGMTGELTSRHTGPQEYELTVTQSQPLPADVEGLFRNLVWQIAVGKEFAPMGWDEQRRAFVGETKAGEVVLTLDKEATLRHMVDYPALGGGMLRGTKKLVMRAHTCGEPVRVRVVSAFTSVYGKSHGGAAVITDESLHRDYCTRLTPAIPYLYTGMYASGLRGEGKRAVHCRAGHLDKLQARVYRIDSAGADTPKLLLDYAKNYQPAHKTDLYGKTFLETTTDEGEKSWKGSVGLPQHLIPAGAQMVCKELELDAEGECTFDPTSLFPDKDPHATYFVQLEGTPSAEWKDHAGVYNQGVLQVTDLGLMWKLSAGRVFAYAYRLSDGAPLPEGTLRMLDKDGMQLAEMPVSEGVAGGAYPAGTRFLQLQQGADCYTTRAADHADRRYCAGDFNEEWLSGKGVDVSTLPFLQSCVFSDRNIYRNGETAHIKGILRTLQGNTLSMPQVERVVAKVQFESNSKEFPVVVEADGTFSLDVPIEAGWYGNGDVTFEIAYKGDADGTAADRQAALVAGLEEEDYVFFNYLENNRSVQTGLLVQDFRRNEFELTSTMEPVAGDGKVKVTAEARNFTGAPLAGGKVDWTVSADRINFYPPKFREYRFGDWLEDDVDFFSVYYCGGRESARESVLETAEGELDAQGKGEVEISPGFLSKPGRCRISSTVSVTNGNEQTLRSVRSCIREGSAVYPGLRASGRLFKVGEPLQVETILVTPEGEAYAGEPLQAVVKVKRTRFFPYRYGSKLLSSIRNEKAEEEVYNGGVTLAGTPGKVEIPTKGAGLYDVTVEGKDAQGKPFYTAVRYYVWGDKVSPWEYQDGDSLELTADKDSYKPGDTARVLVQTPVDAELLITVEREGVLRSFRRTVKVENPVVEVPLEAGDAPLVHVGAYAVQGAEGRAHNGLPLTKAGDVVLLVDDASKHLGVALQTPEKPIGPKDECHVSGTVTDAQGKPVANAEVALYAEDEGTQQVLGYEMPNPYMSFYSKRPQCVYTFGTDGQLIGDVSQACDYGNKGIFIGGGEDDDAPGNGQDPTVDRGTRRDFNPCALWLAHVRTDENGRFSATYRNPDTMTRYRVMAVASAGVDKFGTGEASYRVAQAIMLEPSAPLHATEGDCLQVPVTLTMLSELLPEGTPAQVTWKVTMQGGNATTETPLLSATLAGDRPTTIHFPVTVGQVGKSTLTWSVATEQAGLEKAQDAVELGFDVVPPTPHLRLPMLGMLTKGKQLKAADLLSEPLRPESETALTVSLSPLTGVGTGIDYLFRYPYGCSEQIGSTLLPWILQDTLVKWTDAEYPANLKREDVISRSVNTLMQKRRRFDGSFGYWDSNRGFEFTPYVAYVLTYCKDSLDSYAFGRTLDFLEKDLRENPEANLLSLMVLAKERPAKATELLAAQQSIRKQWSLIDRWMVLCAELDILDKHAGSATKETLKRLSAMYDTLKADTRKAKPEQRCSRSYAEPPFEALMQIAAIRLGGLKGSVSERLDYVRDYAERVVRGKSSPCSTREMAWCCIMVDEFCQHYGKEVKWKPATVNGKQITFGNPLRLNDQLGKLPVIKMQSAGKVYVSGLSTGYAQKEQGTGAVDKGFEVSRRYEKLMPEGSWMPTAEFEVGDVVRVTLSARGTKPNSGRYLMAEDRLPAGFEAVNPELSSQGLPEGVNTDNPDCWRVPGWVDHVEYHKDRVLFSATSCVREAALEASYIVRVVKAGKMTAPAAKVEMMYSPGTYGLSIPETFEVAPRKD